MLRREDDIAELNRLREECDRLKAERAAREAEIATVREEIAAKAMELERGKSHVMGFDACPCDPCFLRGIAARLGGAT